MDSFQSFQVLIGYYFFKIIEQKPDFVLSNEVVLVGLNKNIHKVSVGELP